MMAHLALADAHRLDAHSTCFGARTMAKLGRRLRALRPGAVVMTLKQVVVALKVEVMWCIRIWSLNNNDGVTDEDQLPEELVHFEPAPSAWDDSAAARATHASAAAKAAASVAPFDLAHQTSCQMSWGRSLLRIYKRRETAAVADRRS